MTLEQVIEKLENSGIHEIVLAPNQLLGWLKELRDTRDLEEKHWNECMQIARYDDELAEAKRLLQAAIKVINENCDGFCEYCKYYTKFNLSSCELGIDVCENNNQWEWKYEAEALKLLGEQEG